jgi:hypothetical protein
MTKIEMQNVNHPGKVYPGDAAKYHAMRQAFLKVLPTTVPGITLAELNQAVLPHLPQSLFPGGATAGWWVKAVQLDLEAQNIIARERVSPLRLRRLPFQTYLRDVQSQKT